VPLEGGWRWWDIGSGGAAAFVTEVDGEAGEGEGEGGVCWRLQHSLCCETGLHCAHQRCTRTSSLVQLFMA
jgi:hypothetical protein